jgi:hypothetical protein
MALTENYVLDSLHTISKYYQQQYDKKIERIEFDLFALLSADQSITKEITTLLLQLHGELLEKVLSLGKEYEINTHKVHHKRSLNLFSRLTSILNNFGVYFAAQ